MDECLEKGDMGPIKAWLNENIHQYGLTKTAVEIIEEATGEPFSASYYTEYLKLKYTKLYIICKRAVPLKSCEKYESKGLFTSRNRLKIHGLNRLRKGILVFYVELVY